MSTRPAAAQFSFLKRLLRAAHHRAEICRIVTRQLMLRGPASRHSASPSSCMTRLHTPPSPRPCDHARGLRPMPLSVIVGSMRSRSNLAVRPICHRNEDRIEAHIFVAFLAYCLQPTLKASLSALAGGLTPRQALDKFKSLQRVDAHTPTTDGREPTPGREASCPRAWRSRRPRPPSSRPRLKRLQARGNSLRCPSRRRTADRPSRDAGR